MGNVLHKYFLVNTLDSAARNILLPEYQNFVLKAENHKKFLEILESCEKELKSLMVLSMNKISTRISGKFQKYIKENKVSY